jgi:hypothetical protein
VAAVSSSGSNNGGSSSSTAGASSGRRTPLQCYADFMAAFRDEFGPQLGHLIEEVVVGSGPCGELRYPSYLEANGWRFPGVGEFICYDRRALASLAAAAEAAGRPEWGYAGPHDSGAYNSAPADTGFFKPRGSWDTGVCAWRGDTAWSTAPIAPLPAIMTPAAAPLRAACLLLQSMATSS